MDHQEDTLKYKLCCINNEKCGPYKRLGRNGTVRPNQLNEPINKHFKFSKQNSVINGMRFRLLKTKWGNQFKKMI